MADEQTHGYELRSLGLRPESEEVVHEQPRRTKERAPRQKSDEPSENRDSDMEGWDVVGDGEQDKTESEDTNSPAVEGESVKQASDDTSKGSEVERLRDDLQKANVQIEVQSDQIARLCKQVSVGQTVESGEFLSATSTPFSSMTAEPTTGTAGDPSTPAGQPGGRGTLSSLSEEPLCVTELRRELKERNEQWEKAEKRAKHFEEGYHATMERCVRVESEVKAKNQTVKNLTERLENAEARVNKVKQHSTTQSQHISAMQNEAKERDAEAYKLQKTVEELEGCIQVLNAEKEAKYLEHQQTENTLPSLRDQVKKLTNENAALLDRLRKFGVLQQESHQLATKVAELQGQLKKVSAEREEMKGLLELAQAQANIYEEDFKTEREDRTRAFAEREKEREQYRDEIERLQTQLKSHKGNLSDLENIHLARSKELVEAMEELKKCQEEVQAKTSQVKQYKKQHDGLVAKVATLEREKKELVTQFEVARQQLEERSKKKQKSTHTEGEQTHAAQGEYEKRTKLYEIYREKSRIRKAQLVKMTESYSHAKQELLQVKKEVEKLKKDKKRASGAVSLSGPISDTEVHELCRTLQDENEELRYQVRAIMDTNQRLNDCLEALKDEDTLAPGSPTSQGSLLSPEDDPPHSGVIGSEKTTSKRPRSSTFSGSSRPALPLTSGKHTQSSHHYEKLPGATAVRTDIQHADYVNQSRIQEMLANSPNMKLPLSSPPPDESTLPAPIVVFTEDSRAHLPPPAQGNMAPANMGGGGLGNGGGGNLSGQERERRGSTPAWASGNPQELHERQHQQYGPTSLPTRTSVTPQPPASVARDQHSRPPPPGPTAAEREAMMLEEQRRRQGDDILTPGITTEVHGMARDVVEELEERGGHEVTGTPYDPNLTCIICHKMFRIGEIQLYRTHTATCSGTMV